MKLRHKLFKKKTMPLKFLKNEYNNFILIDNFQNASLVLYLLYNSCSRPRSQLACSSITLAKFPQITHVKLCKSIRNQIIKLHENCA